MVGRDGNLSGAVGGVAQKEKGMAENVDVVFVPQKLSAGGVAPTFHELAADTTYYFVNDGATFVHVDNQVPATSLTVTFYTQAVFGDFTAANLVVTVNEFEEKIIGPFRPDVFNNQYGQVHVGFNYVTDVAVACMTRGG